VSPETPRGEANSRVVHQHVRVLVTGATANRRDTAALFARRGASVVITGRNPERDAQTVAAIEAAPSSGSQERAGSRRR